MNDPTAGLKFYLVGGAVRDRLLGQPEGDQDFVVVGATPDDLLQRGFQPVGKDFPVFLHPITKQEYALARTERKTAPGYHGFVIHANPDVTLEEDLRRRDLTINALAQDQQGSLIDFYNGYSDLTARILRHVSPAFAEDPVRILRIARFAARFANLGFQIAPETLNLMREMVQAGEVDALVPERVWQEIARALMEPAPARFFIVLRACGALKKLLPELDQLWGIPQPEQWHPEIDTGIHVMLVLEQAALLSNDLPVRFAALCHDLGKGNTPVELLPRHTGHEERGVELLKKLCARLRVPSDCRELALITARFHGCVHKILNHNAQQILTLFEQTDALRRPARFNQLLIACKADYRGRTGYTEYAYPQSDLLQKLLAAIGAIKNNSIVQKAKNPQQIPALLQQARLEKIQATLQKLGY